MKRIVIIGNYSKFEKGVGNVAAFPTPKKCNSESANCTNIISEFETAEKNKTKSTALAVPLSRSVSHDILFSSYNILSK